ncbi:hypothetical protein HK405_012895, partial [Cladochytrium tenue]
TLAKLKGLNTFLDCSSLTAGQLVCTAVNEGDAPNALGDMSNCLANYTLVADDSCEAVSVEFDLTVTQLLSLNSYLDCTAIVADTVVCVEGYPSDSTSLVGGTGSSNKTANVLVSDCTKVVTLTSDDTCLSLANANDISITDLYEWNSNLDCWSLVAGASVCVAAPEGSSVRNGTTLSSSSSSSESTSSASANSTSSTTDSSSSTSSTASNDLVQSTTSTSTEDPQTTQQQEQQQDPTTSSTTEWQQPTTEEQTPTTTSTEEQQPTTTEQPATTTSDSGSGGGSSGLSNAEQETLDRHNSYRSEYGIPSISWNSGLASEAYSYASYLANSLSCALVHSGTSGEGENLTMYGATAGAGVFQMYSAVDGWMTEDPNTFDHASQVLWRGSTNVGCGIAMLTNSDGSFCQVVVCRYTPQGNIGGETYANS